MRFNHIILTCLIIIIVYSCTDNTTNDRLLQLADQYMISKPDISLHILDSINGTNDEKSPYFALLYTQAKYRNYVKANNDSLIKVALSYYSTCNDSVMKARTYLVAAQIYDELDRKDIALNFIHKAIIPAEKINDDWIKCYIYYLWGAILQDAADTDESSEKLELSLYFARELNDTSIIINRLYELSYNYIAEKDYATGLERLNLAIELARQTKSYKYLALLYGRKSLAFYMLGNYREALAQINNAMPYNKYLGRKDSISELNYKV